MSWKEDERVPEQVLELLQKLQKKFCPPPLPEERCPICKGELNREKNTFTTKRQILKTNTAESGIEETQSREPHTH